VLSLLTPMLRRVLLPVLRKSFALRQHHATAL